MTRSIWLDYDNANLKLTRKERYYDVVIVGGGLIGAGIAYYLSRRNNGLKVCLVESTAIAQAATARNAGFVLRGIQTYYNECVRRFGRGQAREIYSFAEENQDLIKEFVDEKGADISLESCGSFILAASIEELEELEESYELLKEDSFDVDISKDDPIDRDFYGALLIDRDFGINPIKLSRALLEESTLDIYENEHVLRINRDHQNDRLEVIGASTSFFADQVFLATNAYSALVDPWFEEKITAYRGQILVTQPLSKEILDRICYSNYGWVYFRQLADRRFLLGGRRQLFMDEEIGFADMVTPKVQNALEEYMKDYFGDIVGTPVDYRYSGVMAYTKDGIPLVGQHPHFDGVYFAVGFNGHGLGYGMRMSRLIVEHAFDGVSAGVFSIDRESLNDDENRLSDENWD